MELDDKFSLSGLRRLRFGFANHLQSSPRRIQMDRFGWHNPILELLDQLLFLRSLFHLRKSSEVCIRAEFGRQGTFGAEKEKRELFQTRVPLCAQQAWPPIETWKIFSRERQFLKIILEEKPSAL